MIELYKNKSAVQLNESDVEKFKKAGWKEKKPAKKVKK